MRLVLLTPIAVKFGVVVFRVVGYDDHAAPVIGKRYAQCLAVIS